MASIERRSDTTYRLTVSCGYGSDGKKIRKKKTITLPAGMTPKQVEKELQKQAVLFEREVETGTYLDGEKITLAEFTQKWLMDYAEKRLAPGSLNPYKMRLEKRILPALGHIKLAKLQPHHLLEFYNNLGEDGMRLDGRYTPTQTLLTRLEDISTPVMAEATGVSFKTCARVKRGEKTTHEVAEKICATYDLDIKKDFTLDIDKKLSERTIKHHHGIIQSILATAVKWGLIQSNPAERIDTLPAAKKKAAYYDDVEVATMLSAIDTEPLKYKAMVYLTIDTGVRTGELTGLVWSDIDFDANTVTINKQRQYVSGYGTIEKDPKTDSGNRVVTLSGTVAGLLRQYKKQQLEDRLSMGSAWQGGENVFLHEDGAPLHPHRPYKWFTEFLVRHNLPKITYHQLRHTNASLLISAGVDVVTLSGRLGHADKNITLNTYSHVK